MAQNNFDRKSGFTLIEILIAFAVIGTLMAAILVAVDPVKRIREVRDSNRQSDVQAILEAILTAQSDMSQTFYGDSSAGSAPLIASASEAQVIVADATGIDCAIPERSPLCPQLPAGYSLNIDSGLKCVTRLDQSANGPSTAPTATAVSGAGLSAGEYHYVVTFVTSTGESEPGPIATVVTEEYVP
jgi:prepilin-type N-terminal cleavage/methylation domain-containing protein